MHEPVIEHLEEYLAGVSPLPVVDEHLKNCPDCRQELSELRLQSELFQVLRAPAEPEAMPGFYARVMNRIETQTKPSVWNLFGESMFAKRLAYASAVFLMLTGTFFVSSSAGEDELAVNTPEVMMVGNDHEPVSDDAERNREAILVNLATYQE